MGNLLGVLGKEKAIHVDLYLNFEEATPTPEEEGVYAEVAPTLAKTAQILDELNNYTGAGDAIRQAISKPGKEAEAAAWTAVCPLVVQLKSFFEFSSELEAALPKLLTGLCTGNAQENLEKKQALAKQFADALHFVLNFDDLKVRS